MNAAVPILDAMLLMLNGVSPVANVCVHRADECVDFDLSIGATHCHSYATNTRYVANKPHVNSP